MDPSATTNLTEVHADFVRLFDVTSRRHEDVRDIFLSQSKVIIPETVNVQVGDEIDPLLEYTNASNDQVPALAGLLSYLDQQYPPMPINKYYTTFRRHSHRRDGDMHTTLLKRITQKRNVRIHLETYAPVIYNKRVIVNKVTRPIFIFPNGGGGLP